MRVWCSVTLALVVLGATAACDTDSDDPPSEMDLGPPPDSGASDEADVRCERAGERFCDGTCVDTQSDDDNCGVCSAHCPTTERCVDGVCRVVDCTEAPLAMCGDECVDTRIHPSHCGGCDRACALGEVCDDGACDCPDGVTRCGRQCASLETSALHCGACDSPCEAPSRCIEGRCLPCPAPSIWCAGECVESNGDHCGSCDRRCPAELACVQGECTCPGDATRCANGCATLLDDPSNCGLCGLEVPNGASCIGTTPTCRPGYRACGDTAGNLLVCVPMEVDTDCDDCDGGTACPEGSYCDHGACFVGFGARLVLACGGAHLPGSPPVQCHAYLTLTPATTIEVTHSRFLTWSIRSCFEAICGDPRDGPLFGEGPGDGEGAGVYTPAGQADPERIDEMVILGINARFQRGDVLLDADSTAATIPPYGTE